MDTYLTLSDSAEYQLTEKRSRFLAYVHPAATENEAKKIVAHYRKQYYDARHVCYAYIIGKDGATTRSSDDGEPSGTAGRPLLLQLQRRELTNVVAIVVRYFGGVKLGTGPLGVAYRTAISTALDLAPLKECIIKTSFRISTPYSEADTAMRFIREANAHITEHEYTATHTILTVSVRLDDEGALRDRLAKILTLEFVEGDDRVS